MSLIDFSKLETNTQKIDRLEAENAELRKDNLRLVNDLELEGIRVGGLRKDVEVLQWLRLYWEDVRGKLRGYDSPDEARSVIQGAGRYLDKDATKGDTVARNQPSINPVTGGFVCTKDNPMPKGAAGYWEHKGARRVGECMDGCCEYYACDDCHHRWTKEIAQ